MDKKTLIVLGIVGLAALVIAAGGLSPEDTNAAVKKQTWQMKKFTSVSDFRNYLNKTGRVTSGMATGLLAAKTMTAPLAEQSAGTMMNAMDSVPAVDRYSSTNVQVVGIDEPDIVKTNGQDIFLSQERNYPIYYSGGVGIMAPTKMGYPYYPSVQEIKVIKALPATDIKTKTTISASGNLLYSNDVLVALAGTSLTAFDVKNSDKPVQKWKVDVGEKRSLVGARLYGGVLYAVSRESVNYSRPCPLLPILVKDAKIIIPCGGIYHPVTPVNSDVVYTVVAVDMQTGDLKSKTAFTGSSNDSVVYMSQNNIFVTYFYPGDQIKFSYNFLNENKNLVPASLLQRVAQLMSYDISDSSKQTEFYYAMNQWRESLSDDDALKVQNEMQNRLAKYAEAHKRDLEQTGIMKIRVSDLSVQSTGSVPGRVLNQYSLDEYNGNLRVAVTVGQNWWNAGLGSSNVQSANDVYVLGSSMATIGSLKDLGTDERIYAARFIGDRGYLVTFKQIDPLFVLDLSSATNPKLAGELKVPGYSSYLEPIGDHVVLGVGKEDNKVKVALYDVSNAAQPQELSKYILDEYWSEAVQNPHAFLRDARHQIFFIPGSQGGYVFSYSGNALSLTKAIAGTAVQRALYINDNLYVVGKNAISVWDENTWNKVSELSIVSTSTAPVVE